MKNILIIGSGYGSIPAVDGGAIATLVDTYLKRNEFEYKNKVVVYSALSKNITRNFDTENATYRYIDTSKITHKIEYIISGIITKTFNFYIGNGYINKVIKDLKIKKELDMYDIVIVENIGKYSILLNKYFKDKVVLHLHNDYLNINTKFKEKIMENCKSVWGVSKFICNRVREIDKEDKYKVNVKLLYNGIDMKKFTEHNLKKEEKIKKIYNISDEDFVFLYVGRIFDKKGVKELVEAYCKFLDTCENNKSKLLIVGNIAYNQKKYFDDMKRISQKHTKNVKFIGNIKYENMQEIYNISDVQYVPSLLEEAFGLVVVEGISSGVLVIVSDSGGMPEIIENYKNAIISRKNIVDNIYDSMNKLYKNNELIQQIKKHQSKTIKKFNEENYCNDFQKLIVEFK